jgi:hypothetical protein
MTLLYITDRFKVLVNTKHHLVYFYLLSLIKVFTLMDIFNGFLVFGLILISKGDVLRSCCFSVSLFVAAVLAEHNIFFAVERVCILTCAFFLLSDTNSFYYSDIILSSTTDNSLVKPYRSNIEIGV